MLYNCYKRSDRLLVSDFTYQMPDKDQIQLFLLRVNNEEFQVYNELSKHVKKKKKKNERGKEINALHCIRSFLHCCRNYPRNQKPKQNCATHLRDSIQQ